MEQEEEGAMAGMAWEDIAAAAYRAYAASTGNKNYQGLPMPAFADLPLPIRTAWQAAVRHTEGVLRYGHTDDESEQRWNGWVAP